MSKVTTTRKNPGANAALLKRYKALTSREVAQGWLDTEDPEDVTIAAINYFGAPVANIPARDALTPASADTTRDATKLTADAGRAVNRGRSPERDLEKLADRADQSLESHVRGFNDPRNADSTIAAKGFDNPLIGASSGGGRIVKSAGAVVRDRTSD